MHWAGGRGLTDAGTWVWSPLCVFLGRGRVESHTEGCVIIVVVSIVVVGLNKVFFLFLFLFIHIIVIIS